jgi:hypothetical protein
VMTHIYTEIRDSLLINLFSFSQGFVFPFLLHSKQIDICKLLLSELIYLPSERLSFRKILFDTTIDLNPGLKLTTLEV